VHEQILQRGSDCTPTAKALIKLRSYTLLKNLESKTVRNIRMQYSVSASHSSTYTSIANIINGFLYLFISNECLLRFHPQQPLSIHKMLPQKNCLVLKPYPSRLAYLQLSGFVFRRYVFRNSVLLPALLTKVPSGFDSSFS
jgi:hypothetical protein